MRMPTYATGVPIMAGELVIGYVFYRVLESGTTASCGSSLLFGMAGLRWK
jgi:hypothetical protein